MEFNTVLYWALAGVYPDMTVRSLSRMLGKSDGYWSSVMAQKMAVSNTSLVHLLDALECQSIITEAGTPRGRKITEVKSLICDELVTRFQEKTGIYRKDLQPTDSTDPVARFGALPFIVSSY